jgi:hypothetical protein
MKLRETFEHGFAALLFGGAVVLVFGGTLAACFAPVAQVMSFDPLANHSPAVQGTRQVVPGSAA